MEELARLEPLWQQLAASNRTVGRPKNPKNRQQKFPSNRNQTAEKCNQTAEICKQTDEMCKQTADIGKQIVNVFLKNDQVYCINQQLTFVNIAFCKQTNFCSLQNEENFGDGKSPLCVTASASAF